MHKYDSDPRRAVFAVLRTSGELFRCGAAELYRLSHILAALFGRRVL